MDDNSAETSPPPRTVDARYEPTFGCGGGGFDARGGGNAPKLPTRGGGGGYGPGGGAPGFAANASAFGGSPASICARVACAKMGRHVLKSLAMDLRVGSSATTCAARNVSGSFAANLAT